MATNHVESILAMLKDEEAKYLLRRLVEVEGEKDSIEFGKATENSTKVKVYVNASRPGEADAKISYMLSRKKALETGEFMMAVEAAAQTAVADDAGAPPENEPDYPPEER